MRLPCGPHIKYVVPASMSLHMLFRLHRIPSSLCLWSPTFLRNSAQMPSSPQVLTKCRQDESHAYRHFHFKFISVIFNANVSECPLDKARWTKDEYELQVSWKCYLEGSWKVSGQMSHSLVSSCPRSQTGQFK